MLPNASFKEYVLFFLFIKHHRTLIKSTFKIEIFRYPLHAAPSKVSQNLNAFQLPGYKVSL
jgi:hypothetical protein